MITTGQGGFVVVHDDDDYELLKLIRNQGVLDAKLDRVGSVFGLNFKFTDIQAAVGLKQVRKAEARAKHCQAIHQMYEYGLPE